MMEARQARQLGFSFITLLFFIAIVVFGYIVSNKKTFLSVKAFELSKGDQFRRLQDLLSEKESDPEVKVRAVMKIYDKLNIKTFTENLAGEYIEKAYSMLEKVDVPKERKKELTMIAGSLIGRVQ